MVRVLLVLLSTLPDEWLAGSSPPLQDVFSDASMFEKYSTAEGEEKEVLIRQLHRVLQPFILRRLKIEVEKGLPPKKELVVYCDLTPSQRQMYQAVLKNNMEVLNTNVKERTKLMNTVMQVSRSFSFVALRLDIQGSDPA